MGLKPDPSPIGPVTLEYEITWEDMIGATLAAGQCSSETRYNRSFWTFAAPTFYVLSVLLGFLAGADFTRGETRANLLALLCVLAVAEIGLVRWMKVSWGPGASVKELRRHEEAYRMFAGRRTMHVAPDGLTFGMERGHHRIPWEAIVKVEEAGDWIFLYYFSRPLPVPKRAFPDDNAIRSFLETVRSYRGK